MQKLTIGKLADGAGINLETIRYYERIGLMPEPGRTRGGHRTYAAFHIRRLTFIRRARELGFSVNDVRALLNLAEPHRASCGEVQKLAAHHLQAVRAKLTDLTKLEKILANMIAQCGDNRAYSCPVLAMLESP